MWDLPWPGIKPVSPALQGTFLTTGPPAFKSKPWTAFKSKIFICVGLQSLYFTYTNLAWFPNLPHPSTPFPGAPVSLPTSEFFWNKEPVFHKGWYGGWAGGEADVKAWRGLSRQDTADIAQVCGFEQAECTPGTLRWCPGIWGENSRVHICTCFLNSHLFLEYILYILNKHTSWIENISTTDWLVHHPQICMSRF